MATSREVVTRALRRLRVTSIVQEPAAEDMRHALACLNDMLTAYERGLQTETYVLTGNTANGSRDVTALDGELFDTDVLVVGMNVTGAGIAADTTVHAIITRDKIELDKAATANGAGVALTFEALPFDDSLTEALVSVLAVRMAEDYGASVGPILARDARRGQAQIDGAFLRVPTRNTIDDGLVIMPANRVHYGRYGIIE